MDAYQGPETSKREPQRVKVGSLTGEVIATQGPLYALIGSPGDQKVREIPPGSRVLKIDFQPHGSASSPKTQSGTINVGEAERRMGILMADLPKFMRIIFASEDTQGIEWILALHTNAQQAAFARDRAGFHMLSSGIPQSPQEYEELLQNAGNKTVSLGITREELQHSIAERGKYLEDLLARWNSRQQ